MYWCRFSRNITKANFDICIVNLKCINLITRFDQRNPFLTFTNMMYYITRYMLWWIYWLGILLNTWIYLDIGCLLYKLTLNNDFSYERKFINNTSTVFDSVTIEIYKIDTIANTYLIRSVYRSPTELVNALTRFFGEFSCYLDDVQKYIGMHTYVEISLIIYLQITLRKFTTTLYFTCCVPIHNAVNRVNRAYMEVENIHEKKTTRTT